MMTSWIWAILWAASGTLLIIAGIATLTFWCWAIWFIFKVVSDIFKALTDRKA